MWGCDNNVLTGVFIRKESIYWDFLQWGKKKINLHYMRKKKSLNWFFFYEKGCSDIELEILFLSG